MPKFFRRFLMQKPRALLCQNFADFPGVGCSVAPWSFPALSFWFLAHSGAAGSFLTISDLHLLPAVCCLVLRLSAGERRYTTLRPHPPGLPVTRMPGVPANRLTAYAAPEHQPGVSLLM